MKRLLLLIVCTLALVFCGAHLPPVGVPIGSIDLEAQSLPVTKGFTWQDAAANSDGVLNYNLKLDGVVVSSPTALAGNVTFTTVGAHVVSVTAVNVWGEGSAVTLNVNVKLPGAPTNLTMP